ncbi:hypothetical protein Catovirus_1_444 [Catovirus CTV1]|uniref:Uncharacterized protein n=1 Tax=Catovirus CTV1 TaxID=1977631 RepID=A0A1V0S9N4_9VIRU|nr:hypothetical protein Catovirus_1_444 [Catovirus CTV1]
MEYILSFETCDNNKVNYIVTKNDVINDTQYMKNLDEMDFQTITVLNKNYKYLSGKINVTSNSLEKYLNNNIGMDHETIFLMLYFMDSRVEKIITGNVQDIISNKFSPEVNKLIYEQLHSVLIKAMIIYNVKLNDNGFFVKQNSHQYNGELFYDHKFNSKLNNNNINIWSYNGGLKLGVRSKEFMEDGDPFWYSVLCENKIYNAYLSELNIMKIIYSPSLGKLSKINIYHYITEESDKFINFKKYEFFPKTNDQDIIFPNDLTYYIQNYTIQENLIKHTVKRTQGFDANDVENLESIYINQNNQLEFRSERLNKIRISEFEIPLKGKVICTIELFFEGTI